jgi:hypothetical protein
MPRRGSSGGGASRGRGALAPRGGRGNVGKGKTIKFNGDWSILFTSFFHF